ncbi:hypothetical protein [Saccharothrix sp. Mg75]|uniref:hypothetical protein n=1 Tax=Saccharothrix sp. Mg75 TaxID=3445357 RepID=UPI003EE939EF
MRALGGPVVVEGAALLPDLEAAFRRWMARDARFARVVARRARALGYRVEVADGTRPVVGLPVGAGPVDPAPVDPDPVSR